MSTLFNLLSLSFSQIVDLYLKQNEQMERSPVKQSLLNPVPPSKFQLFKHFHRRLWTWLLHNNLGFFFSCRSRTLPVALELLLLLFLFLIVGRTVADRKDLTQLTRPSDYHTHTPFLYNNMLKGSIDLLEDACTTEHLPEKYQQL